MAKQSKYVATQSIGFNMKKGGPEFKAGDPVPENHQNLEKWRSWGLVAENQQYNPEVEEVQKALDERPTTVPIFPIKLDINDADTSNESPEDKLTRIQAQSLSSLTVEDAQTAESQALSQRATQTEDDAKKASEAARNQLSAQMATESGRSAKGTADPEQVKTDLQKLSTASEDGAEVISQALSATEEEKATAKETTQKRQQAMKEDLVVDDEEEDEEDEEEEAPAPKKPTTATKKPTRK